MYKLIHHQKNFSRKYLGLELITNHSLIFIKIVFILTAEEIILNAKEHPEIKKGDIVEIYHPDDEGCRLLLQVRRLCNA